MDFDINQLNGLDYEQINTLLDSYIATIVGQFRDSEEGKHFSEAFPNYHQRWIRDFMQLGINYGEGALPEMRIHNVKAILEDLFPRKVVMSSKEEAVGTIQECIAFWSFLKRAYSLENADAIIGYLKEVEPEFPDMMFDSTRFGPGKSFVSEGLASGFDMTSETGRLAFMEHYNKRLQAKREQIDRSLYPIADRYPAAPNKAKKAHTRKKNAMAKASRRRNRR